MRLVFGDWWSLDGAARKQVSPATLFNLLVYRSVQSLIVGLVPGDYGAGRKQTSPARRCGPLVYGGVRILVLVVSS
jgi:hypothetical protein